MSYCVILRDTDIVVCVTSTSYCVTEHVRLMSSYCVMRRDIYVVLCDNVAVL